MKTLTVHAAMDLRIEDRPRPGVEPGKVLIRMERGGICGSDLHYYRHGGFGTVRLRQPMILGHEIAGQIAQIGEGVAGLKVGQRVAVSPSRPCGSCRYCQRGQQQHCLDMRFYGSAMPYPHIQGAFREELVVDAVQCVPTDSLSAAEAAMAEPLAVVLHAAGQAGALSGRRVLVTGCGPIGLLAVGVARASGAVQIVATDIADFPLRIARETGADMAVNVMDGADGLAPFETGKGSFDILFECTGVASALAQAIPTLRPGGRIVQLGLGGDMSLPVQAMTAKELEMKGSFRFHHEFPLAVEMMEQGRIDVKPLISRTLPLADAVEAFEGAGDRSQVIKMQIAF